MLRNLPQLQRLLEWPDARSLIDRHPRDAVVEALRSVLDEARAAIRAGHAAPSDPAALLGAAAARLAATAVPALRRVINATGIVLHTNLGRAPLAAQAAAAAAEAAGYANLEFDLGSGTRGSRTQGVEPLLCALTGAESALAVNNCAAAVLLALAALAPGGEVLVSRGELVEIGGGFRIPDIVQQGGARLVEVGTTNKTRLADYRRAITPATRVLLKVHRSNFRMAGFVEDTPLPELAALARETGLHLVQDLGSGALHTLPNPALPPEPTVRHSIDAGTDLVAFSGDKLLGGPQSGLLVGRRAAIDPLRRHPLLRAIRLDKLVLAALEATLRLHQDGAHDAIPTLRMLGQDSATLTRRAEALAALIPGARIVPGTAYAGGGTLPEAAIPSIAVVLDTSDPDGIKQALRHGTPPVIARIAEGRLLLDMLTVADAELPDLAAAIRAALPG